MNPRFHEDGTSPEIGSNTVFVFGSNTAGRHGRGAAKHALKFGAKYGRGEGFSGQSYAIPTKDAQLRTLSLDQIRRHVDAFIEKAIAHPELNFFVTRIGCVLAGYRDEDIAPMFARAPENCSFAEEWRAYLDAGPHFEIQL